MVETSTDSGRGQYIMRNGSRAMVSVCVVTYNQEKYIRDCVQSIVDQVTDFPFEVLISDDCSTDNTIAIVGEFETNYPGIVKVVSRDKNVGALRNFLLAHNEAMGTYIAHCDGDDCFLPNKLQSQFDYLERNSNCTVVWHRTNFFDDAGGFLPGEDCDYSMFEGGVVTFGQALRLGSVAINSSIMYRRCARKTFEPNFDVIDLFYTLEYLTSGYGMILDKILGEYRVNALNAITKSSGCRIKLIYAHHANYYFDVYPEKRRDIFMFSLTNLLLDLKNRRRSAFRFFVLVIRTFCVVSPSALYAHFKVVRKLRIPPLRY
jgi:glycosyltransferase involved in cell wall biosynthesis